MQPELDTSNGPVDLDEVWRAKCCCQASTAENTKEPTVPPCNTVRRIIVQGREGAALIAEQAHGEEENRTSIGRGDGARTGGDGTESSKDLRICQVRPACIISGNNPEIATGFPLQRMVEIWMRYAVKPLKQGEYINLWAYVGLQRICCGCHKLCIWQAPAVTTP